jgi:predicted component of type VI protein secretion system
MNPMNTRSALILAAPLALLAGCATTGSNYQPLPREPFPASSMPAATDLRVFSDQCAQKLVARISSEPRVATSNQRVVIYLGAIEKVGATPVSDYDTMRRRLQDSLVNSDIIRRQAMLIEQPEINDAQLERLRAPGTNSPAPRYDPNITFVLNGYFGEYSRGQGYYLQMKLVHLGTGEICFSDRYDSQDIRPPR